MGESPVEEMAEDVFDRALPCVVSGKLSAWTGVLRPLTKKTSSKPTSKTANGGMKKPDKQPLPCAEAAVCRFDV